MAATPYEEDEDSKYGNAMRKSAVGKTAQYIGRSTPQQVGEDARDLVSRGIESGIGLVNAGNALSEQLSPIQQAGSAIVDGIGGFASGYFGVNGKKPAVQQAASPVQQPATPPQPVQPPATQPASPVADTKNASQVNQSGSNAENVAVNSPQTAKPLSPEQRQAAFDAETRHLGAYQKAGGGEALRRGDQQAFDAINEAYKARGQQTGETITWGRDANGTVSISGYGAKATPREQAIQTASNEYAPKAERIAAMQKVKLIDASNPDYVSAKDKADIALKTGQAKNNEAEASERNQKVTLTKQQSDELNEFQKLATSPDESVADSQRYKELKFKFAPDTTLANDPLLKELASKIGSGDGTGNGSADKAYWMRYYQLHPATRGFKYDEIMDLVDRQMGVEVKRANGGIIPRYAYGGIVDDSESMYSLNADIGSGRAGRAQAVSDANLMGKVEQWKQAVGFDDMSSTEQRNATVGLGGMNQPSGGRALRNYQNAQAAILSDKIGAIKSANSAGNETGFGVSKPTIEKPVATDDLFDKMYEDEFTFAKGGAVNVSGKRIIGPGTAKSDSIPAIIDGDPSRPAALSTGEYVMPVEAVRHYGVDRLNKMKDKAIKAMNGRG